MAKENWFTELPGWAKGVTVVAGVGLFTVVSIIYGGSTIDWFKNVKSRREDKNENKAEQEELSDKIKQGQTQSFANSQYLMYAQSLKVAFDGWGTSTSSVMSIFSKMKNDTDVLKLITAYGTRTISSGRFSTEPDLKGTLAEAITSELSASEISKINGILSKANIKYQF